MTRSFRGALIVAAAFALTGLLAGCLSPMNQREAQSYASLSLRKYCADTAPCGTYRLVHAERLKPGWLLDFESDKAKYGVMVHDNGVTQVSVWQKGVAAP
jgi:hypothetical protein